MDVRVDLFGRVLPQVLEFSNPKHHYHLRIAASNGDGHYVSPMLSSASNVASTLWPELAHFVHVVTCLSGRCEGGMKRRVPSVMSIL
jgi:hypothetical protein